MPTKTLVFTFPHFDALDRPLYAYHHQHHYHHCSSQYDDEDVDVDDDDDVVSYHWGKSFFWVSSLPPNAIHKDNCSSTSLPPALSLPMTLFDSLLNTIRDLLHFRQRFQIQNAFRQLSVCSGNSTLIVGSILKITETTSPENYFNGKFCKNQSQENKIKIWKKQKKSMKFQIS